MLVEAAKLVLPKYPEWKWELYGTGDTLDAIQKNRGLWIGETTNFKRECEDAYQIYGEYAFLVLPSYREGLPLVLLEAKALGLPMISFDVITGPREIIDDSEDWILDSAVSHRGNGCENRGINSR